MYLGLPSLLLSAAVFLTHSASAAALNRYPASRASPPTVQQIFTMLALTVCVPEESFLGRLLVVVAGRGFAAILVGLATTFIAWPARTVVLAKIRQPRLLGRIHRGTKVRMGPWLVAGVLAAACAHVSVALCLALARLYIALAASSTSPGIAAGSPRAAPGRAAPMDLEHRSPQAWKSERTAGQLASGSGAAGIRARGSAGRHSDDAGTPVCSNTTPAGGQGCRCHGLGGPAALAATALAAGLAMPSGIACARAAWVPPAPEDAVPALAIACWAMMLASTFDRPSHLDTCSGHHDFATGSGYARFKKLVAVRCLVSAQSALCPGTISVLLLFHVIPIFCAPCISGKLCMHLTPPGSAGALARSQCSAAAHHDDPTGFYMQFCISLLVCLEYGVHGPGLARFLQVMLR